MIGFVWEALVTASSQLSIAHVNEGEQDEVTIMPREIDGIGEDVPDDQQIFRYWVELRCLHGGSTRNLPVTAVRRIHPQKRKNEPWRSDEQLLRLQDGSETLEAESFDELVAQLRERYPDESYERFLRRECDPPAEPLPKCAMDSFGWVIAKAAVDKLLSS